MRIKKTLSTQELLCEIDEHECLLKFIKGKPDAPLVVFVPGGRTTARLFYGVHAGSHDPDFLAHWINKLGYNFLGASYPLEMKSGVFQKYSPGFTAKEWGRQVIAAALFFIEKHQLSNEIILCGWSMGGKVALTANLDAMKKGLQLKLFIGIAATPPIPGLMPQSLETEMTEHGNWFTKEDFPRETEHLRLNNIKEGRTIIPKEVFIRDYLGHNPMGLLGIGYRYKNGKFVANIEEELLDHHSANYIDYPPVASIQPTEIHDARHALSDKQTWGMVRANSFSVKHFDKKTDHGFTSESWNAIKAILEESHDLLAEEVEGNHLFFLGEKGAKATAQSIDLLINRNDQLERRLFELTKQ